MSYKSAILILFLLMGILLFGCTQGQQSLDVAGYSNNPPQQPQQTYACPDGTIVTDISNCPATANPSIEYICWNDQTVSQASDCPPQQLTQNVKTEDTLVYVCADQSVVDDPSLCDHADEQTEVLTDACSDGTAKLSCSSDKPYFCDTTLSLIQKASRCGCPTGYDAYTDTCLARCPDGTRSGLCSTSTTSKECQNGVLYDNPAKCGCQDGYEYDISSNNCEIHVKTDEDVWLEDSVEQNHYLKLDSFDLTIIRAGYYTDDSWFTSTDYIRLDIEIRNTGDEPKYFFISNMALVDSFGNQYDYTYGGTFDSSKLHTGTKRSGSVYFEMGEERPSEVTLKVDDGYDSSWDPVVRSVRVILRD
ncbi:DUF4352 domain-containing protein [bacterium]|nr:DUF4352 domain-containing protein [bacterium]MBU1916667.1 DUF4352 domain-containing protein [bacterium]